MTIDIDITVCPNCKSKKIVGYEYIESMYSLNRFFVCNDCLRYFTVQCGLNRYQWNKDKR